MKLAFNFHVWRGGAPLFQNPPLGRTAPETRFSLLRGDVCHPHPPPAVHMADAILDVFFSLVRPRGRRRGVPRSSCRGVASVADWNRRKRGWSSRESSATSRRQGGVNATRRRAKQAALALNINGLFTSTKRGGRASGPVDRLAC